MWIWNLRWEWEQYGALEELMNKDCFLAWGWSQEYQDKGGDVRNGQITKGFVSNVLEFEVFPKANENQLWWPASRMVPNALYLWLPRPLHGTIPQQISAALSDP